MQRNPDWARDELILALDLYFRSNRKWLEPTHPDIIELSNILNQLPLHPLESRNSEFRNPQGVSMKLGNFLSLDPQYEGKGLQRGGKLDLAIWREFSVSPLLLHQTAIAIKNSIKLSEKSLPSIQADDEEEFREGKILTRIHQAKERNRQAIEKKKKKVLRETCKLICEVCDFDFAAFYGALGEGFAECHHTIPIAILNKSHITRLSDLAIVCANCHRMIHRSQPMMSVDELRHIVRQETSKT